MTRVPLEVELTGIIVRWTTWWSWTPQRHVKPARKTRREWRS